MNPLAKRLPYPARLVLFDLLDFHPFPAQVGPLSDTTSFTIVFAGGVGSSKTEIEEKYLLAEILPGYMRAVYLKEAGIPVDYPGKEVRKYFWVVAPDYQLPREVFQRLVDDLNRLKVKMDGPNMPMEGEWFLRIKDTGTEIQTKSAGQPNSFHSKALTGIAVDESALISDWLRRERLVPRLTRGGASDPWLFCSGTFEGIGWMSSLYDLGQGPNEQGVASYCMATWENVVSFPDITQETKDWLTWYCQKLPSGKELDTPECTGALERLKWESRDLYHALTTMPTDSFAQRYGARPQKPSGLVFQEFDYAKHVSSSLKYDPEREVEVWIDPGAQNPYAVLAVQFRGEHVEVIDELYYRQATSEEVILECIQRPWWRSVRAGQIDATQVEQRAVWERSELWSNRKLQAPYLRAQKVLIDIGIERLRLWLRQPGTELTRLTLSDRCVNTIKEFSLFRWETMRGEQDQYRKTPVDKWDHCVIGDTLIETPSGRKKIRDLVGTRPYVYCVIDGKLEVRQAEAVFPTLTDTPIVHVVMDRDDLFCTPDHLVMMANGQYKEAGRLRAGESLMAFNRHCNDSLGYTTVGLTGQRARGEHLAVWESLYGPIPPGIQIHHRDKTPWNNEPDNLEALTAEEHASLHHRGKIIPFPQRQAISVSSKRMWQERGDELRPAVRENAKAAHEALQGRVVSEEQRAKYGAASREVWNRPGMREAASELRRGRPHTPEHNRKLSQAKLKWWAEKKATGVNHRVVCVLPAGTADVYDMTVRDAHNFVASGVVVHNSLKALWYGIVSKWGIGAGERTETRVMQHRPRFPTR